MATQHIGDTTPTKVQTIENTEKPRRKVRYWFWVLLGIFVVIVFGAIGSFAGYRYAINLRMQKLNSQIALVATTQYQLGLQDMEAQRYDTARKRFEYVVQLDPNFPGAAEKLTEVMMLMALQSTPTPVSTPTIEVTPTPDLRSVEEMFTYAQELMRAKQWKAVIEVLDMIRSENLNYRTLDVDGMYYIALRNRGIDKIVLEGNLEGGVYDLALTERFGPLDHEADGYRNWVRLYLTGASFWGLNWQKVVEIFSQIYPSLPNLRDGSGMTAAERFRVASIRYGDQLVAAQDYCGARDQYRNALSMAPDSKLAPTATAVQLICQPPTPTPAPTFTPSPTSEIVVTQEPTTESPTSEPMTATP